MRNIADFLRRGIGFLLPSASQERKQETSSPSSNNNAKASRAVRILVDRINRTCPVQEMKNVFLRKHLLKIILPALKRKGMLNAEGFYMSSSVATLQQLGLNEEEKEKLDIYIRNFGKDKVEEALTDIYCEFLRAVVELW